MRSEKELKRKLKQATFRVFQKRLEKELKIIPVNCVHNYRHRLDANNRINSNETNTIGLCMLCSSNPENWDGRICDKPEDICDQFEHKKTKVVIKEEVQYLLNDFEYVARNHKDVAALRWDLAEFEEDFFIDRDWTIMEKLSYFIFPLRKKKIIKELAEKNEIDNYE